MISGEDWDLTQRVRKRGYKVGRIVSHIDHNEGRLTYFGTLRKKLYYSQKAGDYISENVGGVKQILLYLFRPAYFRNWRLLLRHPVYSTGFLFLKYSEFFVGGFFAIIFKPSFWKSLFKK
jgi:hypothetical protein